MERPWIELRRVALLPRTTVDDGFVSRTALAAFARSWSLHPYRLSKLLFKFLVLPIRRSTVSPNPGVRRLRGVNSPIVPMMLWSTLSEGSPRRHLLVLLEMLDCALDIWIAVRGTGEYRMRDRHKGWSSISSLPPLLCPRDSRWRDFWT